MRAGQAGVAKWVNVIKNNVFRVIIACDSLRHYGFSGVRAGKKAAGQGIFAVLIVEP